LLLAELAGAQEMSNEQLQQFESMLRLLAIKADTIAILENTIGVMGQRLEIHKETIKSLEEIAACQAEHIAFLQAQVHDG